MSAQSEAHFDVNVEGGKIRRGEGLLVDEEEPVSHRVFFRQTPDLDESYEDFLSNLTEGVETRASIQDPVVNADFQTEISISPDLENALEYLLELPGSIDSTEYEIYRLMITNDDMLEIRGDASEAIEDIPMRAEVYYVAEDTEEWLANFGKLEDYERATEHNDFLSFDELPDPSLKALITSEDGDLTGDIRTSYDHVKWQDSPETEYLRDTPYVDSWNYSPDQPR